MDELRMYRLLIAGLESEAEDENDKAVVRSVRAFADMIDLTKGLIEDLERDESRAMEIADLLERIVGQLGEAADIGVPHFTKPGEATDA